MFYFLMHLLPPRNAFLFSPVNWVSWRALVCLVLTVKQFWRLVGTRIAMPPGSFLFFTFWLAFCSRAPRSSSKRDHQEFCWVQCPVYSLCYSQRASEGWPGQVQWQVFFPCCVLGGLLCGVLHECSFWFHFALQSEKGDFDVGYCFLKGSDSVPYHGCPCSKCFELIWQGCWEAVQIAVLIVCWRETTLMESLKSVALRSNSSAWRILSRLVLKIVVTKRSLTRSTFRGGL